MIAPGIASVTALEPYVVRVVFVDGEVRDVDVEPLLGGRVFAPLRDRETFARVMLNEETGTVTWPGGADLDRDVIYGGERPAGRPAALVTTPRLT